MYVCMYNQYLEKIELDSKLNFAFVSFPYKLNYLYFYCYCFLELMSIFFYTASI